MGSSGVNSIIYSIKSNVRLIWYKNKFKYVIKYVAESKAARLFNVHQYRLPSYGTISITEFFPHFLNFIFILRECYNIITEARKQWRAFGVNAQDFKEGIIMEKNSSGMKLLVAFLIFLYVVSPIDAMPGPIDDVIVVLMGIAMNRKQIGGGGEWSCLYLVLSYTVLKKRVITDNEWRSHLLRSNVNIAIINWHKEQFMV